MPSATLDPVLDPADGPAEANTSSPPSQGAEPHPGTPGAVPAHHHYDAGSDAFDAADPYPEYVDDVSEADEASAWSTYQEALAFYAEEGVIYEEGPRFTAPPQVSDEGATSEPPTEPGSRTVPERPGDIEAFRNGLNVPEPDRAAAEALANSIDLSACAAALGDWAADGFGGEAAEQAADGYEEQAAEQPPPELPPLPAPNPGGNPPPLDPVPTAKPSQAAPAKGYLPRLPYGPSGSASVTAKRPSVNWQQAIIVPTDRTSIVRHQLLKEAKGLAALAAVASGTGRSDSVGTEVKPPDGYNTAGKVLEVTATLTVPYVRVVLDSQGEPDGILILPIQAEFTLRLQVGISLPKK